MNQLLDRLKSWLGPLILVLAAAAAYAKIFYDHATYNPPEVATLRLCHWQLEPGFRESIDELIKRYEELYFQRTGKRINLVQIPINGRVYPQYVNCGLIGGVAPDLIQMGRGDTTINPSYIARFFEPITDPLMEPNPYNAGASLADVPWKQTFFDDMRGNYEPTLLQYYAAPFTRSSLRFFYNKDLFRTITGHDNPPSTFADLQEFFRKVEAYNLLHGARISPISGSAYQLSQLSQTLGLPFRADLVLEHDMNFDGRVDKLEAFLAYRKGGWDFSSPALEAMLRCLTEVASQFQPGWQAALRDDALFNFLQQRSVMITSGSWDAVVIPRLSEGKFEVGVFATPVPMDHPEYGRYVRGPRNEAGTPGGIGFGINARSPHKEIAMDFTRFCTSQAQNEWFCSEMGWTPVVKGAKASEAVIPFQPITEGFSGEFDMDLSPEVALKGGGMRVSVIAGRVPVEEYSSEMNRVLERTAEDGFERTLQQNADRIRNTQRLFAGSLAASVFCDESAPSRKKIEERATALLLDEHRDAVFRTLGAAGSPEPAKEDVE